MPAHFGPMIPLKIQEDDFMNDAELQEQAALDNDQALDIFVGRVQLLERLIHGMFDQYMLGKALAFFFDPSRLWGKFFAPPNGKTPTCTVPPGWANFFYCNTFIPKNV